MHARTPLPWCIPELGPNTHTNIRTRLQTCLPTNKNSLSTTHHWLLIYFSLWAHDRTYSLTFWHILVHSLSQTHIYKYRCIFCYFTFPYDSLLVELIILGWVWEYPDVVYLYTCTHPVVSLSLYHWSSLTVSPSHCLYFSVSSFSLPFLLSSLLNFRRFVTHSRLMGVAVESFATCCLSVDNSFYSYLLYPPVGQSHVNVLPITLT